MDLWVRSQDREDLRKVDGFYISDVVGDGNSYYILERGYDFPLGEYKTKERALKIFDELQNLLHPNLIIKMDKDMQTNEIRYLLDKFKDYSPIAVQDNNLKVETLGSFVYNMPKE